MKFRIILCLLALLFVFPSCGKKAPPVPRDDAPAAVCGLAAQATGGKIDLTWDTQGCGAGTEIDRYVVYRCREAPRAPCAKMPQHFQAVAVLSMDQAKGDAGRAAYQDIPPLVGDFVYKIKAVDQDGRASHDSDFARVRITKKESQEDASF